MWNWLLLLHLTWKGTHSSLLLMLKGKDRNPCLSWLITEDSSPLFFLKIYLLIKVLLKSDYFHKISFPHSDWMTMVLLVCALITQLCPLSATPCTVARQVAPSMGFSTQEYWSGLPSPSSGDFPDLGIETGSPASQADSLLSEPAGKPSGIGLI